MKAPVIAIDGASCTGKGTIANKLAEMIGFHRLDCGKVYRAFAHSLINYGYRGDRYRPGDPQYIADAAKSWAFGMEGVIGEEYFKCRPVFPSEEELRSDEVLKVAYDVSPMDEARNGLLEYFRKHVREPGLVADGREVGAFQFPDADMKFFLTASEEVKNERARGRNECGKVMSNETHLTKCEDAVEIDTSRRTPDETAALMKSMCLGHAWLV